MSLSIAIGETAQIPYGAIATLLAGALAVFAAWRLGLRQIEISDRQTRIAEANLKIQLFEKRADCVEKMREIAGAWMSSGSLNAKERSELQNLMWQVQLLFPTEVVNDIEEAFDNAIQVNWRSKRAEYYNESGKPEKAREYLELSFENEDMMMELMPSVLKKLRKHTRIETWD